MRIAVRLLALLSACVVGMPLLAQISYNYANLPASGSQSFSVAAADLNLDGLPDLIGSTNNAVDIYLATGPGAYGLPTTYALPFSPAHIETPDVNNDGYPDLVIGSYDSNAQVMILINNGNGTFHLGTPITPTAQLQGWAAAGDLNNDGKVDLVVREQLATATQFVIYLGNGDGTFTRGQVIHMRQFASYPLLQDFNGDGNLDIAAVDGAKAFVWLGNGKGIVTATISITAPSRFDNLTSGDFNNDGIADLALVYSDVCGDACPGPNNNRVYIYRNNGKAQFTLASTTDFGGCSAGYPVAADVNGDGNMDLNLVGPDHFCGFSVIAYGNGKGGFTSQSSGPSGDITSAVIYRDLNLDSRKDVALSDVVGGDLAVGLATGGSTNCAPPPASKLAGKLCYPLTTAPATFMLRASGNSPSGVKRLEIWIDGVKKYQKLDDQLAHTFTLAPGQHHITVVAVDKYEGYAKTVKTITVQ